LLSTILSLWLCASGWTK